MDNLYADTMNKSANPKSVQFNIRLTPNALAKINEGRDKFAEISRKPDMSMSEYVETRCSIDNLFDNVDEDVMSACVSSINFGNACIEIMESLIEMFGDGTIGKQICHDNKDLSDMVAWGKAVVKRMQKCAELPADKEE